MMITEVMKTMMLIFTQILYVLGMVHNNTSNTDATQCSGATLKYMDWDGSLGGVRYRAPRVLKSPCSTDTVSWKSQADCKCLTGRVDSTTSCSPQLPASRLLLHREQLNPTQR